jgi:hypothetical protein
MSELPDWLEEATNDPNQIYLFNESRGNIRETSYTLDELRGLSKQSITKCECCGGRSKVYAYKLGSYARVVCWMAYTERSFGDNKGEYFHIPSSGAINGGGDYAKLRYWDLIEPMPTNPDPKKRSSGLWRLTDLGRNFAHERTSVSSTCYYRHPEGGVIGFEPEQIGIKDVLGKHFDYKALMNGHCGHVG